jgi:hypothetical protein
MFKRGITTGDRTGAKVVFDSCSSSSLIRSFSLIDSSSRAGNWLVRVVSVGESTDPSTRELDWLLGKVEPLVVDCPSKGTDTLEI